MAAVAGAATALLGVAGAATEAAKEAIREHKIDETSRAVAEGDVRSLSERVERLRRASPRDPGDFGGP